MLHQFMDSRNTSEKKEILAKISSFHIVVFQLEYLVTYAIIYRAFIGRDFKVWMQMGLFIVPSYLTDSETKCWYLLSKVYV